MTTALVTNRQTVHCIPTEQDKSDAKETYTDELAQSLQAHIFALERMVLQLQQESDRRQALAERIMDSFIAEMKGNL